VKSWALMTARERVGVAACGVLLACVLSVLVLAFRFDLLLGLFLTGAAAAFVAWVAWSWE
jgi:hypothetical protein